MSDPPTILAFDCAGSACAVALRRGPAVLAASRQPTERGHAALLVPAIAAAVDAAQLAMADIELIAVTTGPGSFTGIRIGLATARGLALALARPLAGIDCFAALRAGLDKREIDRRAVLIAIDSRREELFFADGAGQQRAIVTAAAYAAGLGAGRYLALGDGADALRAAAGGRADLDLAVARSGRSVDAAALALLAGQAGADYWAAANAKDGLPRPLYLRPPDVTLAKAAP